jgi:hypothetical protein
MNLPTGTSAWDFQNAEAASLAEFLAEPQPGEGHCTQCGGPGAEVPWGQRSKLCWSCTDVQLDLMALACQTESGLPVEVKLA